MPTPQTNPDDANAPRRGPTEIPDQASVDRSRQQGLGFGARELDMQGDPKGANVPDNRPIRLSAES